MVFILDGLATREIRAIFESHRPEKIVETGTFLGQGSTRIIAGAIKDFDIRSQFYSIECNPSFFQGASSNLASLGLRSYVNLINGLSIPRTLLPPREDIITWLNRQPPELFDDLQKERNAANYIEETSYGVPDDQLNAILHLFDFKPDFVLLDSAGYVGYLEFHYLLSILKGPTFIVLDDAIRHVKHYESWQYMKGRPDIFKHIFTADERYGIVGYYYTPREPAGENSYPGKSAWNKKKD